MVFITLITMVPTTSLTVCKILDKLNGLQDSPDRWVFRGQSRTSYPCVTSFARQLEKKSQCNLDDLAERHMSLIQEIKCTTDIECDDKTIWIYTQHVLGYTNLLDVTIDPKVALSFALKFGKNRERCMIMGFCIPIEYKDKKQKNFPNGYGVSLIDPLNIVFPEQESESKVMLFNPYIEAQKGAFLYCNRHKKDEREGYDFDEQYSSGQVFDIYKYFDANGIKVEQWEIDATACKCAKCEEAIFTKDNLFPEKDSIEKNKSFLAIKKLMNSAGFLG